MQLLIVESPTKAKTIEKFLGKGYTVQSSFGHIRDLPKGKLGVDVEHGFEPQYVIPVKARKVVKELKEAARKADAVILSTDADREGEAISFHLKEALGLQNPKRIVFHEITKHAIEEALKSPRGIDLNLVNSQQARRILDRLVGYKLSPFLWKKVARNLSAGRVQSVAVRLVAEREREIQQFKPQEYWSVEAMLREGTRNTEHGTKEKNTFGAFLAKKDGKAIEKLGIKTKEEADSILKELEGVEYKVASIEKKEVRRNPLPPFTTSTLQQEAWKKLHMSAKTTMAAAQQLYETGHITYHRTDSLNISQKALEDAQSHILERFGKEYWSASRVFKTKSRSAQEAHEAIHPTYANNTPDTVKTDTKLRPQAIKLYDLIWRRFIASQMSPAVFDSTSVEIEAGAYAFRATGQMKKFDGFLKVYPMKFEEMELPKLAVHELLELVELKPEQHFTQPPARYTEASLVKALEEHEIGRPSTYAPTLAVIQERGYVEKDDQKRFMPTDLGFTVNDLLVAHFPEIVDIAFTAAMEKKLDDIAEGKHNWVSMMQEFYRPFQENLEKKYEEVSKKDVATEATDKKCPKCGSALLIRLGRFGKFYACSAFPKCKHTENLNNGANGLGIKCPKCKKGDIVEKRTKSRKIFYGCNQYPACDFALWDKPTKELCKECGSLMVEKGKKTRCSSADCIANGK